MVDQNPFEVAASCSGALPSAVPLSTSYRYHVEGELLACGSSVTLPEICIFSGRKENLLPVTRKTEFPSMKLVLSERHASVTYFVSDVEMSRRGSVRLWCSIVGIAASVLLIYWILGPFSVSHFGLVVVVVSLSAIFCSVLIARWQQPSLQLVRYVAPGVYWIRGLPLPYLKTIAAMAGEALPHSETISADITSADQVPLQAC